MALLMSDRCEQGVKLIWYQADPQKFPEGIRCLEEAIQEGDSEAYYFLARCYTWEEGGIKEDERKAYSLYKEGANLGSYRCIMGVDRMNKLDKGFRSAAKHTLKEAFEKVKEAAQFGEPFAAYQIGCAYYWGDVAAMEHDMGLPPSFRDEAGYQGESLKWYEMAAKGGVLPAMANAAVVLANGEGVPADRARADEWWIRLAREGDLKGAYNAGLAALRKKDYREAYRLFSLATKGPVSVYAYYYLARVCLYGDEKDAAKAAEFYRIAAEGGDPDAQCELAGLYVDGEGVPKDYEQAYRFYKASADQGNLCAIGNMGWLYDNGYGCTLDYQVALAYYRQAIEKEKDGYAHYRVGRMYELGHGFPVDYGKAVEYYTIAASMGNQDAKNKLPHFKKSFFGKWKKI